MRIIQTQFEIALYPEGIQRFNFEEETDENGVTYSEFIENSDIFEKHICTDKQSKYVLSYLKEQYEFDNQNEVYYRSLKYEGHGIFTIEIVFNNMDMDDDESIQEIEVLVWPSDIHDDCILFIEGNMYQLDIDNINYEYIKDEHDEDEDDVQTVKS
jgi:hypothetical protein